MESRQSRMQKYYDNNRDVDTTEETTTSSRSQKNQRLYKEVSNLDLKEFDLNSNVSVIGENTDNISLDEIKDILSEKYKENPRRKSFGDTEEIDLPKINLDETREYDINAILEKAKDGKESNYEEDRLKKVRSTQYDILKTLDIMNNEEEVEEDSLDFGEKPTDRRPSPNKEKEEAKLHDLIDTITAKELIENEGNLEITGEMDPLDILSDLRGEDENTKVMGALVQELIEESKKENELALTHSIPVIKDEDLEDDNSDNEDTLGIEKEELPPLDEEEQAITLDELEKGLKEEKKKEKTIKKENIEDSFIGSTTVFKQEDFDDFDDLKDNGIGKVIIKILIILIVIAFIAGCVVLANHFLDLGLF